MTYWITSTNPDRLDDWKGITDKGMLPVTTARPMMIRCGKFRRPFFMVDADALTDSERFRLIGRVWVDKWVSWQTAVSMVEVGVLIDGRDCEIVEPVESYSSALLLSLAKQGGLLSVIGVRDSRELRGAYA